MMYNGEKCVKRSSLLLLLVPMAIACLYYSSLNAADVQKIISSKYHHEQIFLNTSIRTAKNATLPPSSLNHLDSVLLNNSVITKSKNTTTTTTTIDLLTKTKKSEEQHVVFILVGAIRTLNQTKQSIMNNVVRILCPPPNCVSHIVLHLSNADNRPSDDSKDGIGVMSNNTRTTQEVINNSDQFLQINTHDDWSSECLQYHLVQPTYEIGSEDEQRMMDIYETEYSQKYLVNHTDIIRRLRIFRFGDPRRYSMWFARAWAWRYIQKELPGASIQFDFYMFLRPDMLWFQPTPTLAFFHKVQDRQQNQSKLATATDIPKDGIIKAGKREVYVHDTYFGHVADTFAFLPTYDVADSYLSLFNLIKPGVACLGGPSIDKEIVRKRLKEKQNIVLLPPSEDGKNHDTKNTNTSFTNNTHGGDVVIDDNIWCKRGIDGWSERILGHKLAAAKLSHQTVPAGAIILRPNKEGDKETTSNVNIINCNSLSFKPIYTAMKRYQKQDIPYFTCLLIKLDQQTNWTQQQAQYDVGDYTYSNLLASSSYLATHPFIYRNTNNHSECLAFSTRNENITTSNDNDINHLELMFQSCQEPALFAGSTRTKIYGFYPIIHSHQSDEKGLKQLVDVMNLTNSSYDIIRNIMSSSSELITQEPIELFSKSFTESYKHSYD